MFALLKTTLTLDDALALVEVDTWARSWLAAAHRNSDALALAMEAANAHDH